MPRKYPTEVKDRAVRMVLEHQQDYSSITATCNAVGPQLGVPHNTLRRWVEQARVDEGDKPGTTTAESEEVRALRKENRRLREANEKRMQRYGYKAEAEWDRRLLFAVREGKKGEMLAWRDGGKKGYAVYR